MPIVSIDHFCSTTFDYLIIGGGTSGLTLAARLSENLNTTVGVIEAGGHDSGVPEIDIPGFMGRAIANPVYDWTFFSVPQRKANDRVVLQPRGKGLGGSSLSNFLGLFRPSKEEFDALEHLGNPGWNWNDMLKYIMKSEKMLPSQLSPSDSIKYAAQPDPHIHGSSGPIKKSFPSLLTEQHALLFDAAEKLGVPRNGETGNGVNVGAMTSFTSVDPRTAKRSYSATGYFEPNASRQNLLILTHAQAEKVLLQKSENNGQQIATGVEFMYNGTRFVINGVRRDIILSAGALQTPQLLELSGIGNPEILAKHGIKQVINLPGVGENLQDHVCVTFIAEIDSKFQTMDILSDPHELDKHEELYKHQQGLLASAPAPGFLFLPAKVLGNSEQLQSWLEHAEKNRNIKQDVHPSVQQGLRKQHSLQSQWFLNEGHAQAEVLNYIGHQPIPYPVPVPGRKYTSFVSAIMHPLSRGSVHVGSADPIAPPLIDPNYLVDDADLDLMVYIVKFTLKLLSTPPLSDIIQAYVLPSPDMFKNDDNLREWVRETCGPVYHPVGTAAMLPEADGGVVNHQLKVYGTSNLRVVDASILPMELSCHIQSVAYAIGEKAADILTN